MFCRYCYFSVRFSSVSSEFIAYHIVLPRIDYASLYPDFVATTIPINCSYVQPQLDLRPASNLTKVLSPEQQKISTIKLLDCCLLTMFKPFCRIVLYFFTLIYCAMTLCHAQFDARNTDQHFFSSFQ